jgi:geranylgeranyl diphosphate synthase type I
LLGDKTVDEKIWKASVGVELVHTAILMHDDFMDRDMIRRGSHTTHRYFASGDTHYGDAMAICIGDAILCNGFEQILECGFGGDPLIRSMSKTLRAIANTAHGQAYDVTLEKLRSEWTEDDVITSHKAKTSIYTFENPLHIGGLLGEISEEALLTLHDYSMDAGVAFQIQDDILGVYGDPDKTGKSVDSDLLQGKCTLLVLKVFSEGVDRHIHALEKVWGKKQAPRTALEAARKAITDSGALAYAKQISREYSANAARSAARLRTHGLNNEAINFLEGIAQYMVEREL